MVKKKILNLLMSFVILISAFGLIPAKEVEASTEPIGVGAQLPINKIIAFDENARNTDFYYTLTLSSSGVLTGNSLSTQIDEVEIRNSKDDVVIDTDRFSSRGLTSFMRAGKYSVRIKTGYDSVNKCVFYFNSANETFKETEAKNNDTEKTASKIKNLTGNVWTGIICKGDKMDYYTFTLNQKSIIDFSLSEKSNGIQLSYILTKSNGANMSEASLKGASLKQSFALEKGTYRLCIASYYCGLYNFRIKAKPIDTAAKTLISRAPRASVQAGKLVVSWNKFSAATGYQIQVSGNKRFSGKKTYNITTNVNKKSLSIVKNWKGKTVYVRIRAYKNSPKGSKVFSSWSKTKAVKI
ncbi:MAG: hypothetical protein K6B68_17635 [Eubacterium sp.]|nr:hypothetical protein [Eubacterium sp.]